MAKVNFTFEISYSFYLCNEEDESTAKEIARDIANLKCVEELDWYDDGEDYCFDIIAEISSTRKTEEAVCKAFELSIDSIPISGDYHYIKGTNNEFYWQP